MRKLKLSLSPFRHLRSGESRSQALLEFALALPVLLVLMFGIIDFALLFQAWLSVENIARQTVRFAVTGEYDVQYCSDYNPGPPATGCTGTDYLTKQDAARLQTIHARSQQWQVALLKSGAGAQTAKGYLRVLLCSSRDANKDGNPDYQWTIPVMASGTYANCVLASNPGVTAEDAGGPGDNVFVFVDFNHPLITPFLSQVWPMVHLVSYRQGVVETFRTSHSIAQVGQGLQFTPTASNTPTSTPIPTSTPLPTSTPSPTKTNTPTPTNTPTITPTPDCALFAFTGPMVMTTYGSGLPRVQISVSNSSGQDANLSSLTFIWTSYNGATTTQILRRIRWNGTNITSPGDASSPTGWAGSVPLLNGNTGQLQFDFSNSDPKWPNIVPPSSFGLTVSFDNGCVVNLNAVPFSTLTPSRTPSPTITLTPSRTPSPTITLTPSKTLPPSNTPTKTPVTPSLTPSKTPIPSNTPTKTPVTPTDTPRPPTNTPKPPTATPKPPTSTPIIIPTNTPKPPPTRTPVGGGG